MPAILLSLLPLLAKIAPDLVDLAFAGNGSAVAGKVETVLRDLFGTTDATAVTATVAADPSKADALKARLAAETEQLKASLADVADARAQTVALARASSPLAYGTPIISGIVVVAFVAIAILVAWRYGLESGIGQLITGALIAKFGTVVDYWLGSSKGTTDRTDQMMSLLHQAVSASPSARGR